MKRIALVVAALMVVLVAAPSANAAMDFWFTVGGTTGGGVDVISQGPGAPLVIEKPQGPGIWTFEIELWVVPTTTNIASFALDLSADSVQASASNNLVGSAFAGFESQDNGTNTPFPLIVNDLGAASVFSTYSGPAAVAGSFTITIDKMGPGADIYNFYAGPGNNGFGYGVAPFNVQPTDGTFPTLAGLETLDGAQSDVLLTSSPVISIQNIPEPATIALLGLGGLALIRRRR